jgi:hypothetical protein
MRHLRLPEQGRFRQCLAIGHLWNVNRPSPLGGTIGGGASGDLEIISGTAP